MAHLAVFVHYLYDPHVLRSRFFLVPLIVSLSALWQVRYCCAAADYHIYYYIHRLKYGSWVLESWFGPKNNPAPCL